MARTKSEIEQVILAAKAAESGLDALSSTSKTAIWRLWVKITASAHWVFESLIDLKIQEMKDRAAAAVGGTDKWYADRMLEFQYGHSLVEQDGKLVYLVDDPASRIITKVASKTEVVNARAVLKLKVAKGDVGSLVKLTDQERTAAWSYLQDILYAGTNISFVSLDADLVKITGMKVYYDGKLILADFKTAFELAINTYLNGIYFNGVFSVNKFRDACEKVPGLIGGPDIPLVEIKPVSGAYTQVAREYNPDSGYFIIDPAFPLSDPSVIEYIPV